MKKIFLILCILLTVCSSVFAEKKEYKSQSFDFTAPKKIFIGFSVDEQNVDKISDLEISDIMRAKITNEIVPALQAKNKIVLTMPKDVAPALSQKLGRDFVKFYNENPEEGYKMTMEYVNQNADIRILIGIANYGFDTRYVEGTTINMPSTQTSNINILGSNGQSAMGTVTTNTTTPLHIPGRNRRFSEVSMFLGVFPTNQEDPVWAREEYRSKAASASKPKDLLNRIVDDFFNNFYKTIEKK